MLHVITTDLYAEVSQRSARDDGGAGVTTRQERCPLLCSLQVPTASCGVRARRSTHSSDPSSDISLRYIPPIKVAPLVEQLLGADAGTIKKMMTMAMVKGKAKAMVASALPPAKAALFSTGMAKLFVLELGPLLTALLLCGRIGGAYAGEVGTMQARRRRRRCRRRRRRRAPCARGLTQRSRSSTT